MVLAAICGTLLTDIVNFLVPSKEMLENPRSGHFKIRTLCRFPFFSTVLVKTKKKTFNHVNILLLNIKPQRFTLSLLWNASYILGVQWSRLEIFSRYCVQPATPQIIFLWENIERQMRVPFTVRKAAWNTTSESASTKSRHFVLFLTANTSMQWARDVIIQTCY